MYLTIAQISDDDLFKENNLVQISLSSGQLQHVHDCSVHLSPRFVLTRRQLC
ncbi:hypothetical protein M378DRAFT_163445 [Amanita muscaria Koide BX008]|uniref:Uncharacterized protein n=1 Tax=Amanita muscaria (strain Koide BX008) TaxID=946122 RepID=A0A0C2SLY0_AMAMK|nr:hypothetical protein M378DRAFT_163445 [Amanita muscaria Koide BX008]